MGQATSILTSTVGSGIVNLHKGAFMASERATQGMGRAGMQQISDDAFTASTVMILNGVNSFMYQLVLFPLYLVIAMQKTVVCTANDVFGMFDSGGFVLRVGRRDLQAASDVSSGVCLSKFFEAQVESIGETDSAQNLAQGASDTLRNMGQGASSIMVAGSTGVDGGKQSQRILSILGRADGKMDRTKPQVSSAVANALKQGGAKGKTLFDTFKSSKIGAKLGGIMGKMQLKAPIHLIDSMITYGIGVVSGMQDMAQVHWVNMCFVGFSVETERKEITLRTWHRCADALVSKRRKKITGEFLGCLFYSSQLFPSHSLSRGTMQDRLHHFRV